MAQRKTRLYVELTDNKTGEVWRVVLLPFGEDDDYVVLEERHGTMSMHILVDEGYVCTHWYMQIPRWSITGISLYY